MPRKRNPEGGDGEIQGRRIVNRSAVIVVTHDVRMIEGFDYVYHLKDGHLDQNH